MHRFSISDRSAGPHADASILNPRPSSPPPRRGAAAARGAWAAAQARAARGRAGLGMYTPIGAGGERGGGLSLDLAMRFDCVGAGQHLGGLALVLGFSTLPRTSLSARRIWQEEMWVLRCNHSESKLVSAWFYIEVRLCEQV